MNEGNLRWCFPQINRKAAPGVDGVDYAAFEAELDENIVRIVRDLKAGRYKAKLVRRRYIAMTARQKVLLEYGRQYQGCGCLYYLVADGGYA